MWLPVNNKEFVHSEQLTKFEVTRVPCLKKKKILCNFVYPTIGYNHWRIILYIYILDFFVAPGKGFLTNIWLISPA